MSEFKANIIVYITGFILICVFIYGGWWIKREVNAYFYYDSATIDVICETVKPEYIKDGVCD